MCMQVIQSYETDFKIFIDNMGSAGGLVGAGVICLSIFHHITCTHRRLKRAKRVQQRQKRNEELARLVLRIQRILAKIAAHPDSADGPVRNYAWGVTSSKVSLCL